MYAWDFVPCGVPYFFQLVIITAHNTLSLNKQQSGHGVPYTWRGSHRSDGSEMGISWTTRRGKLSAPRAADRWQQAYMYQ